MYSAFVRGLSFLSTSLVVGTALAQEAAPEAPPAGAPVPVESAAEAPPAPVPIAPVALDCAPLLAPPPPAPSELVRLAARHLEQLGAFEPGPLGQLLIGEIVAELCSGTDAPVAGPVTCGSPRAADVRELRERLITDAARTIVARAESLARGVTPGPASKRALLLAAVLQAALAEPSAQNLAHALLRSMPAQLGASCTPGGQAGDLYRDLQTAAVLLLQLERQLQQATQVSEAELEALARQVLVTTGARAEAAALSELQRGALRALSQDLVELRVLQGKQLDAQGYVALAGAYARALGHALTLANDAPVEPPAQAVAIVVALASGDVEAALNEALQTLSGGKAAWPQQRALLFGMRVVRSRSEEEARGMLARAALGLGPWADRWVVGLNLGVPRLDIDDFRVVGDAKLGYNASSWGAVAKGSLSYYDLTSSELVTDNLLAGGSGDVWITFNAEGQVKGELRADLGIAFYDTTSTPIGVTSGDVLSDENSLMLRGNLLGGLRVETAQVAVGLWLGGGAQHEIYDQLTVDTVGQTHIEDLSSTHVALTGRLRAQFPIVPEVLVGRVRIDALRHSITRESLALDIGERTQATGDAAASVQLDAFARAFIDLEIAKFFGFVPALEAGFDYFALSDEGADTTNTVPILGVGIRRTEF